MADEKLIKYSTDLSNPNPPSVSLSVSSMLNLNRKYEIFLFKKIVNRFKKNFLPQDLDLGRYKKFNGFLGK
jgi:hypothetical protein